MNIFRLCLCFLACELVAIPCFADTEVSRFVDAWNSRQMAVDSIYFEFEGTVFTPTGFTGTKSSEDVPDHQFTTYGQLRLDFVNQRAMRRTRKEVYRHLNHRNENELGIYPVDEVNVYNGSKFKVYAPTTTNELPGNEVKHTELHIYPGQTFVFFDAEHEALLLSVGLIKSSRSRYVDNLRVPLNANDFHRIGEAVIDGQSCVIVQTNVAKDRFFEYTVESEPPYLVRAARRFGDDKKLYGSMTIEYQETKDGFLPKSWQASRFSFISGKAQTFDMRLTSYEVNKVYDQSDFDVDPPPGTTVYDATRERDSRSYVIGDELAPEIPIQEHELQVAAKRSRNWTFLMIASGVAVAVGGVLVYRRMAA